MVLCFKCSQETKEALDTLVRTGEYSNYSEAISLAVANLALLQGHLESMDALVLAPGGSANERARQQLSHPLQRPRIHVPDQLALPTIDEPPREAPLPPDAFTKADRIPLESWIFGQYNRLLPAKVSCRGLANMLLENPAGVPIEAAGENIVESAAELGHSLAEHEDRCGIHRDDALSTAFPTSGTRAAKSRLRYMNQFVGGRTKAGALVGLLADLKLINYLRESRDLVALTRPGWDLALARNPVLEGAQETPTQKFNVDEQELIVSHIRTQVPVEDFAYQVILKAIQQGSSSPADLDAALAVYVSHDSQTDVTASYVSTQRSGAISRMSDLGLTERIREGVRVSYITTERGLSYMRAGLQRSD